MASELTNDPRPVLPYAPADTGGGSATWEETVTGAVRLVLPAPPLWRVAILPCVQTAGLASLLAPLVLFAVLQARWGASAYGAWELVILVTVIAFVWLLTLPSLIHVLRHGRRPAVVTADGRAGRLTVESIDGTREIPTSNLMDIRVDERSMLPIVGRRMRIQVVRGDRDDVEQVLIRWRGGDALVEIERRLCAALVTKTTRRTTDGKGRDAWRTES